MDACTLKLVFTTGSCSIRKVWSWIFWKKKFKYMPKCLYLNSSLYEEFTKKVCHTERSVNNSRTLQYITSISITFYRSIQSVDLSLARGFILIKECSIDWYNQHFFIIYLFFFNVIQLLQRMHLFRFSFVFNFNQSYQSFIKEDASFKWKKNLHTSNIHIDPDQITQFFIWFLFVCVSVCTKLKP